MPYPLTPSQNGDLQANITFCRNLLTEFRQKNIDEGINASQAMWAHHRMRAWDVNYSGNAFVLDLVNLATIGNIDVACLALIYGTPDDMSNPKHWLSADRINWLITEMKSHLGWP